MRSSNQSISITFGSRLRLRRPARLALQHTGGATRSATAILAAFVLSFTVISCEENKQPPSENQQSKINNQQSPPDVVIPTTHTAIGSSGYSLEMMNTLHIETQQNQGFSVVYYFTPFDTTVTRGEAGVYFGPHPDINPPKIEYTERVIDTTFLGKKQKWVEYTTAKYTQRETFIDIGNDQFIHCWCYSDNLRELDRLFKMVLTIRKDDAAGNVPNDSLPAKAPVNKSK